MTSKYVAVLCRTSQEFEHYISENVFNIKKRGPGYVIDSEDVYYFRILDPEQMRGYRNLVLVKTGTWGQLPAEFIDKVELYARMSHN